jgi:hypothetical protein
MAPARFARRRRVAPIAALTALLGPAAALGQELEPRSYSPAPVGSTFVVAGFSHASGELLFDTSSPITDARAKINTAVAGYSRVFDLAGRVVRTIESGEKGPGRYLVSWDGKDDQGVRARSGMYFLRASIGGQQKRVTVTMLR